MSVECLAWAFRQKLPAKPKIVLLALADQADETTGHVCYGRRNMKHLAAKSTCGERTLYRYIAALVRNGYMAAESGKGKGQENQYYLQLDRSDDRGEWTWKADDPEATEPQDIDGGSAKMAEATKPQNGIPPLPPVGIPGLPHRAADHNNLKNLKEHRPADEKPLRGFSRQAQELDRRANRERAESCEPGELPGMTFVIEGTRWWALLVAYRRSIGRPMNITDRGVGKYRGKTGRYVKTDLWEQILKPHSTAGPRPSTMTADDEKYLAETGLR